MSPEQLLNVINRLHQETLKNIPFVKNWQNEVYFKYQLDTLDQLAEIFKAHSNNHSRLTETLKAFLDSNWKLVTSNEKLPNGTKQGTKLCYTACPDAVLTDLLCHVAQFVKDNINDDTLCTLQILIPGLAVDSDNAAYPSLNKLPVKQVLKTHILGRTGNCTYLISVKQFASLIKTEKTKRHNIYFDADDLGDHPELAILNDDEYDRLINHSPETQALFEAHTQYQLAIDEQGSLLTHLNKLIERLRFNSVDGVGSEAIAGKSTDGAMMQFVDYFDRLGNKKEAIPPQVKKEIDLLLEVASPTKKRKVSPMLSCINNLQQDLEKAKQPVEQELAKIGLDEQCKADLIEKNWQHVSVCEKAFQEVIGTDEYCGEDKLPFTQVLLEKFNVEISIQSIADVEAFIKLSGNEISHFCNHKKSLREDLIGQFSDLEDFIWFIHATPLVQLRALLTACQDEIFKLLIKRYENIQALLMTFHEERLKIICGSLMLGLFALIKGADNFVEICKKLSFDQFVVLIEAIKDKLPDWIDKNKFLYLYKYLPTEQRPVFFEAMKAHLSVLIKNTNKFVYIYQSLFTEQCSVFLEAMKAHLPRLIKDADKFAYVCRSILTGQHSVFFEAMKAHLPGLIKDTDEFVRVYEFLFTEQRPVFFEAMKAHLPRLIKDTDKFVYVWRYFLAEQRSVFFEAMKAHLASLIKNTDEFVAVLKMLSFGQCVALVEVMKAQPVLIGNVDQQAVVGQNEYRGEDKLPFTQALLEKFNVEIFIESMADVEEFIKLSGDEISHFCNHKESLRVGLIVQFTDLETFILFIHATPLAQLQALLTACQDEIFKLLIKRYENIPALLMIFREERLKIICESLALRLLDFIGNAYHFVHLCQELSFEKFIILIEAIKDKLPDWIDENKFVYAYTYLPTEQRPVFFEAMKVHLPGLIKNNDKFVRVYRNLPTEQGQVFFEAMKAYLPGLIKNTYEFTAILTMLSFDQFVALIEAMKAHLPGLIKGIDRFEYVSQSLYTEQRSVFFEAMKAHLSSLIKNTDEFVAVLKMLSFGQCVALVEAMQTHPVLIGNVDQQIVVGQDKYRGEDKLPFTKALLEKFNVEIFIESMADVEEFIKLSGDEISHFCNHKESLRVDLIAQFTELKTFILFINETPLAQLQNLLTSCQDDIIKRLIKRYENIPALLITFHKERLKVICESLMLGLIDLIEYASNFALVCRELSFDQFLIFIDAMKDKLPNLIYNGTQFVSTYQELRIEQRPTFLEIIKNKLPNLIQNNPQIASMYQQSGSTLFTVPSSSETANMSMHFKNRMSFCKKISREY